MTEIKALLISGGPLYPKYWEALTADFKKQTGITVSYDLLQFMPLTAKVVTLGAARSAEYDVFSTHTAQIGSYFNYFEPLNKYFSASELGEFYPVAMKYLTDPKTGRIAAIPRNVDARIQYYRTDAYDAHNLKPAVTWDDLVHVSQTLTGTAITGWLCLAKAIRRSARSATICGKRAATGWTIKTSPLSTPQRESRR